jgi:hypothetical protein
MLRNCLSLAVSVLAGSGSVAASVYDIDANSPPIVVRASYFGTHIHRLDVPHGLPRSPAPATPWPSGRIGSIRLWAAYTSWKEIEPQLGRFNFSRIDGYVAQAETNRASSMMVLGYPPQWASARPTEPSPYGPGHAAEPANFDQWNSFIETLATRYKGRIGSYELWNEPYFSDIPNDRGKPSAFYTGSVYKLVELAKRARAVLNRVDPAAQLLTPGFTGDVARFDLFLAHGGGQYVNGVAYHYYAGSDEAFVRLHLAIRAVMAKYGLADLPIYNTESGFPVSDASGAATVDGMKAYDQTTAAAMTARNLVLGAYLGLKGYYQYSWDSSTWGGLNRDGSLSTTLTAYESVRRWLTGTQLKGCRLQAERIVQCEGARDGRRLLIWWRSTGTSNVAKRLPTDGRLTAAENAIEGPIPPALGPDGALELPVGPVPVAVWIEPN